MFKTPNDGVSDLMLKLIQKRKNMNYRKLNKSEIKNLLNTKAEELPAWAAKHLKDYYPAGYSKVVLLVNSEYNDSSYDNSFVGMVVFDTNMNEISPIKGKEVEARSKFIENAESPTQYETYEQIENVSYLVGGLPDLYVKEGDGLDL